MRAYSVVVDRLLRPVRSGSRGRGPAEFPWASRGVRPAANPVTSTNAHHGTGRASAHFPFGGVATSRNVPGRSVAPVWLPGDATSMGNSPILWRGRTLGSGWRRRQARPGPPTWRTRWARYPTGVTTTGPAATSRHWWASHGGPDATAGWNAHRKETGSPSARGRQVWAWHRRVWNGRCRVMLQS